MPSYFPEKICWLLSKDYQNMPGGHVRIFRKSALQEKVEEKGYSLERTESIMPCIVLIGGLDVYFGHLKILIFL
ncbi:MAG: hypothetical protein Ct9H90mP6_10550 [Gammaproteobacteria bacterium]|nr:MAG: hypothetical protein Ct9H90mP6_10550 [Gammaproteobacteria bacterium]